MLKVEDEIVCSVKGPYSDEDTILNKVFPSRAAWGIFPFTCLEMYSESTIR